MLILIDSTDNDMIDDSNSLEIEDTDDVYCPEPDHKIKKYRRFQIIPVINSGLEATELPLIEARTMKVNEKRHITKLLEVLPTLPKEYLHLKRVNDGQLLVDVSQNELDEKVCLSLKKVLKGNPEFHMQFVTKCKPRTQSQYEFSKKHWPVSFHKDLSLESKLSGTCFTNKEVEKISELFMHIEPRKGALLYDSKNGLIITESISDQKRPLRHPIMVCIESLAAKQINSDDAQYLATDFYAILAEEPCTMCAMAIVHCRVKRVFFGVLNKRCGALSSRWRLQETGSLNHHFEVFQLVEI